MKKYLAMIPNSYDLLEEMGRPVESYSHKGMVDSHKANFPEIIKHLKAKIIYLNRLAIPKNIGHNFYKDNETQNIFIYANPTIISKQELDQMVNLDIAQLNDFTTQEAIVLQSLQEQNPNKAYSIISSWGDKYGDLSDLDQYRVFELTNILRCNFRELYQIQQRMTWAKNILVLYND